MKTLLNYIATKKVAKHVNRSKTIEIGAFLEAEGYTRDRLAFTKGKHCFSFSGRGNYWTISYRKAEKPQKVEIMPKDRELQLEEVTA